MGVAEEIDRIARGASLFTFAYMNPPPEGRGLQFASFLDVSAPCDLFQGSNTSSASFIKVALQHSDLGTYEVHPDIDYQSATPTAYLEWTRVADGRALGRARAVAGTVTYREGPTNEEEWRAVAVASARVSADFEKDPMVKSNCRTGIDLDAGMSSSQCTCERLSGAQFTCNSASTNCCRETTGELVHVDFEMRADRCGAACVAAPTLLGLCRML
jgi:hypothetical protein